MATGLKQRLRRPDTVEKSQRAYDELRLKVHAFGVQVDDHVLLSAFADGDDDALWLALLPYAYSREAEFVYANAMYVGMKLTLENVGEMALLQPQLNLIIQVRDFLRERDELNLMIEAGMKAS